MKLGNLVVSSLSNDYNTLLFILLMYYRLVYRSNEALRILNTLRSKIHMKFIHSFYNKLVEIFWKQGFTSCLLEWS